LQSLIKIIVCGKERDTKKFLLKVIIKVQILVVTRRVLQEENTMTYRKMVNQERFTIKTPMKEILEWTQMSRQGQVNR